MKRFLTCALCFISLPVCADVTFHWDKNGICPGLRRTPACDNTSNRVTKLNIDPREDETFTGFSVGGQNIVDANGNVADNVAAILTSANLTNKTISGTYSCRSGLTRNSYDRCVDKSGGTLYSNLKGGMSHTDDVGRSDDTDELYPHKEFWIQFHANATGESPGSVTMNLTSQGITDNKIYCDYRDAQGNNKGCFTNQNKTTKLTYINAPTVNGYRFRGYYAGNTTGDMFYEYSIVRKNNGLAIVSVNKGIGSCPNCHLTVNSTNNFSAAWQGFYPHETKGLGNPIATTDSTTMPIFDGHNCVIIQTDSDEIPTIHLFAGWARVPTAAGGTVNTLYIANATRNTYNTEWGQPILDFSHLDENGNPTFTNDSPDAEIGHGDVRYEVVCNSGYVLSDIVNDTNFINSPEHRLVDQHAAYDTTCSPEQSDFTIMYIWVDQYGTKGVCPKLSTCNTGARFNLMSDLETQCVKNMTAYYELKEIAYATWNMQTFYWDPVSAVPGTNGQCYTGALGTVGAYNGLSCWDGDHSNDLGPESNRKDVMAQLTAHVCANSCQSQVINNGSCVRVGGSGWDKDCYKIQCNSGYHPEPIGFNTCISFPNGYECVSDNH